MLESRLRNRHLLAPDEVRRLSRLTPWRPVVDTALQWALILSAWAVVARWPSIWTVALAMVAVGTRYYALLVIGHDAVHRRLFDSVALNDAFANAFIYAQFAGDVAITGRTHLEHHRWIGDAEDPEIYKYGPASKSSRLALLAFASGLSAVVSIAKNIYTPERRKTPRKGEGVARRAAWWPVAAALVWQIALVAGLTSAIGWWAYPVLWAIPIYVFTVLPDLLRAFLEHAPLEPGQWEPPRLASYSSSRLERLFFSPYAMNFHAAHHLWPSIPYYNLAEATRRMRESGGGDGIEWRSSYLANLWRYARALPWA